MSASPESPLPGHLRLAPGSPQVLTGLDTPEPGRRPWGRWLVLAEGPGFKVKQLEVDPHARLSLQMHEWRAEHWVVISGTATCTVDDRVRACGPGDTVVVPRGIAHRIANDTAEPVVLVEIQLGDHLCEEDIERLEDDYGRLGPGPAA